MCSDEKGFDDCISKSRKKEANCDGKATCICSVLGYRGICGPLCIEKATPINLDSGKKIQELYKECVLDPLEKLQQNGVITGAQSAGISNGGSAAGAQSSAYQLLPPFLVGPVAVMIS